MQTMIFRFLRSPNYKFCWAVPDTFLCPVSPSNCQHHPPATYQPVWKYSFSQQSLATGAGVSSTTGLNAEIPKGNHAVQGLSAPLTLQWTHMHSQILMADSPIHHQCCKHYSSFDTFFWVFFLHRYVKYIQLQKCLTQSEVFSRCKLPECQAHPHFSHM